MKSLLKKLVLLAVSGLVGLLVLELGVRWTLARKPYELPLFEARADGVSYRLRPAQRFDTRIESRPALIQTDRWGNAGDRDIPPERRAGWRRIAVLGDSFAFGLWAEDHRHSMVGVAAEATAAQSIEWVNFAVPGHGYVGMRRRLEQEAFRWQPDGVLLCTFNGNDFRETFLGPDQTIVVNGIALPNQRRQRDAIPAELLPARPPRPFARVMQPLRQRLQVLNLALHLIDQMRQSSAATAEPADSAEATFRPAADNFMSFSFWSMTEAPPIQTQAVARALGELQAIADLCAQRGIPFAVAAIPYVDQVREEDLQGPGYDLRYPQFHVERFCEERSLPYLDMLPAFRKAFREAGPSFYCATDPHFNNEGHALAGRLLADFIRGIPLAPPAAPAAAP